MSVCVFNDGEIFLEIEGKEISLTTEQFQEMLTFKGTR